MNCCTFPDLNELIVKGQIQHITLTLTFFFFQNRNMKSIMEFKSNKQLSILTLTETNIQLRFTSIKECIIILSTHDYNGQVIIFFRFEKYCLKFSFREIKIKVNILAKTQFDHEYFYQHSNRKIISYRVYKTNLASHFLTLYTTGLGIVYS